MDLPQQPVHLFSKWGPQSMWAAVAIALSLLTGGYTAVRQMGVADARMEMISAHQNEEDQLIHETRDELQALKEHDARVEQKLDDIVNELKDLKHQGRRL